MTLHKHWSAPAHADEAPTTEISSVAIAAATPGITHVWVAEYREADSDELTFRVFFEKEGCVKWRQQIATDNWNTGEVAPEDPEEAADAYFEYNEDDGESFNYYQERIRR